MKKDMVTHGNRMIGLPAGGLTILGPQLLDGLAPKTHTAWLAADPLNFFNHPTHVVKNLGWTRSIGSRAAIERFKKHSWYYGITTEFCVCNKSFVFAHSADKPAWKAVLFIFRQHLSLFNNHG